MSRILNEQQMINIIWGSTLMGGGGGGSISSGMDLLNAYKRDNPAKAPQVELVTADEMKKGCYAAATAGMGAPAAIVGVDFSKYAANAFNVLRDLAKRDGKELAYNIPVELGGFSSMFPLLLSMQSGMPTVDADGAGRAVPALETLLLNVNGCPTSPLGLANGNNDKITIELADPYDAPLAEKIGRDICGEFGNMVGISGWLVNQNDIKEHIVTDSMTLTEKIGAIMRENANKADLFEALKAAGLLECKVICKGDIKTNDVVTRNGFDFGAVVVTDDATGETYQINYQNENLLLQKKNSDGSLTDMMTVPDLTCMYCIAPQGTSTTVVPGMPLSNADAKVGMKIAVGVVQVDEKWFKTADKWWTVWAECMEHIGYAGGYLPYAKV